MSPRARLIVVSCLLVTCKPDENVLDKTFLCDASRPGRQCGTDGAGAPLTCYAGKQLGAGRDFCTPQCSTAPAGSSPFICAANQAQLRTCRPSEGTPEDPDGCGPDLACYRTDLIRDEGVCLAMRVCSTNADCKDAVLSTCAGSLLAADFPGAPISTSNLHCVVSGCKARQTACPLGETCLPLVAPLSTMVPDACVPSCDSSLNCPPNYVCWRKVSGPAAPAICLPTLPGARCTSSLDCLVGDCLDTGEGFSLCSVPCDSDRDCALYSESSHKLFCVQARPEHKYCVAISPFAGSLCLSDTDCPADRRCFFTSPFQGRMALGECRLPCGPDDRCPVRGGLPHTCFVSDLGPKSCYPGTLGLSCRRSEDCMPGTTCEALPLERRFGSPDAGAGDGGTATRQVCAHPCANDVDCLDPWNKQEGYCEDGWCRLGEGNGGPCTRDQQCGRGRCQGASGGAPGNCVYPP